MRPPPFTHQLCPILPLLFSTVLSSSLGAIDNNGNGLSDVWEQRYHATAVTASGDDDGDGFTNEMESRAGTDPFDASSRPLMATGQRENGEVVRFAFDTLAGKHYTVEASNDLSGEFRDLGNGWMGDGETRDFSLSNLNYYQTRSPILFEFWADLTGDSIEALTGHQDFPHAPDGQMYHNLPEAPTFLAHGYGARMRTRIEVDQDGFYRFYLSSGGPAELFLEIGSASSSRTKIAEVLPAQAGLLVNEWDRYASQTSELIYLETGKSYNLELRYLATVPSQHTRIAWSGGDLEGIVPIGYNNLAREIFLNDFVAENPLLKHDYDSPGETGRLWPVGTLLRPALPGMTGTNEKITAEPATNGEKLVEFESESNDHLYATWLFQMASGHDEVSILFNDGTGFSAEGPRIRFEALSSGTVAAVRAGGSTGSDIQIDLAFDQTFRVEVVASVAEEGFVYATPKGLTTVEKDRFDIYISDASAELIGSATGLEFRDGSNILEGFTAMRATFYSAPLDLTFDDFDITSGYIRGDGYLITNHAYPIETMKHEFYKLNITEMDQDGDGITDWEELLLAKFHEVLFFDSESRNGTPDATTVNDLLTNSQGTPEVSLFATDVDAYESNFPSTTPNNGEITLVRSGNLAPLTVRLCVVELENTGTVVSLCDGTCCSLVGSAGDEEAEPEDYQLIDEDGNLIDTEVTFAFGEMTKVLTVKAVPDAINEYPETLNIALEIPEDGSYTVSETLNGASIQIFDLPDNPDNITLFTGTFSQDGNAVTATSGSGSVTLTINGPRTEIRIWSEFSGLTSTQQDCHVHKAGAGNTPGPIIYSVTETPGDETTDPLNGPLSGYPWDLTDSSGAVPTSGGSASKQTLIDSLFGQNGESPLYLNIHTIDNPAGEIWAFLRVSGGSIEDPGAPVAAPAPGSAGYPQLFGDLLESEVRRFLNQATFGARDEEVDALVQSINEARVSDPSYHRREAFSEWIDNQIQNVDQTYLLDYTLAGHFQFMTLANIFDPVLNPPQMGWETPTRPAEWPSINRDDPNPEYWYLEAIYPVDRDDLRLTDANLLNAEPRQNQRRQAHWQMMINANDQLRQKMGFALQQIVVVSESSAPILNEYYATANYQDMLNTHAFNHYRDVLGYVNWSPIMGKWLSSLQNQKAIDFDGDGIFDAFPDENLARENMQLFSIGLFEIWPDGSLKLSPEGLPQSTYTNDDIQDFAKILTGQSFSRHNNFEDSWGGVPYTPDNDDFNASQGSFFILNLSYLYPMKMFGEFHSIGPKTFAGTTIDNSSITDATERGIADIEDAIDWLAGVPDDGKPDFDMVNSHVSTPAFISQRLIQRFTTSNPSREYLHRVATVFKDSEGDLSQTLRAILLDPEARNIDLDDPVFGMKKSSLEAYIQLLRSLEAHTYIPLTDPNGLSPYDEAPGNFNNPELYLEAFGYPSDQLDNFTLNTRFMTVTARGAGSRSLEIDPFAQSTVFNFYMPDYSPGGAIGNAGLVAPEMQLTTEPAVIRAINYFEGLILNDFGPTGQELAGSEANQIAAFGGISAASQNDAQFLSRQALADDYYPKVEPESGLTTVADGGTSETNGPNVGMPYWVRINRAGHLFTTSVSPDGSSWTTVATETLEMHPEVFVGLAATSRADGILATAEFRNVTVVGGNGVWFSSDIGDVEAAGSTIQNAERSFTIMASGSDISGTNDEFHFAFQEIDGDFEITARLTSMTPATHPRAKAGVMVRETLESDAANTAMIVRTDDRTRSQIRRVSRGRSSESFADEALLDELDRRLTNGFFKMRYPYDPSDNDDPSIHGYDEYLKNPREAIIDAITEAYNDPFDGSNDAQDRLNKFSDALYLLTLSPEYQIKK